MKKNYDVLEKEIKDLKDEIRIMKKTLDKLDMAHILLREINNDLKDTNTKLLILPAIKQKFEDLVMEQYHISTDLLYSKLRVHPLPGLRAIFSFITTDIIGIDKTTMAKTLNVDRTTISHYNELVSLAIKHEKCDSSIYYIYSTVGLKLIEFIKEQKP